MVLLKYSIISSKEHGRLSNADDGLKVFFLFIPQKGGKKHSFPFRRQKMQIDELVPPPCTSGYPVSQPDDPYVADLLQLADGRFVFPCD